MNPTASATRLRLLALWVAVFARALGENAVRTYAVLRQDGLREPTLGMLFLWLGLAAVPAFALAPLIGALASSRGRRVVMVVATLAGLGAIAWSSLEEYRTGQTFWIGCAAVLACEAAFFSACRFAILPQASRDAHVPLPQLLGVFTVASAAGMLLGLWVGIEYFRQGVPGLPLPLQVGYVGYGLALVCVLLARFEVKEPVRVNDGLVVPFLRTARTVFAKRDGRNALIALWGLFLVVLAVTQWLMPAEPRGRYGFFLALIVGVVVSSLHFHPYRVLGYVPYASIGLLVCAAWAALADNWSGPVVGLAFFAGLAFVPLLTVYQTNQPERTRGHGGALLHAGWSLLTLCLLGFLLLFLSDPPASRAVVGRLALGLTLAGVCFAWLVFFRPAIELTAEAFLWPFYRVRARGPGAALLPWQGPVLIIANHAAWFDPLWVGKILPAPFRPMMTSKFYDLPVISWLVRRVIGAIRVPDMAMRKDAPEIHEAIAALDRGDCVIIFPEGWLRRKEEQELRRFGRGVWQILKARPNTPVFACWIDGNWGSYISYKDGPPTKNKRMDFWRKIRIAILEPFTVDPATLANHMATRTALMKKVLEARDIFGLPPIDPFKLPAAEEEPGTDRADVVS